MKSRSSLVSVLAVCLAITACSNGYEDQVGDLEAHMRSNKIGQSADVWLIKLNAFGEREKTALFFGYWDDWEACYEMATIYMQRYPSDSYSCGFAN